MASKAQEALGNFTELHLMEACDFPQFLMKVEEKNHGFPYIHQYATNRYKYT